MVNFTAADLRNDERYRMAEAKSQFTIPKKLYHKMTAFPKVPWIVATDLYAIAVRMTLMMYNVEILIDVPYGQGYAKSAELFLKAMKIANENY